MSHNADEMPNAHLKLEVPEIFLFLFILFFFTKNRKLDESQAIADFEEWSSNTLEVQQTQATHLARRHCGADSSEQEFEYWTTEK